MKRSFINKQSGSNKFWSVELKQKNLHLHFGKTGTEGRLLIKEFLTKALATRELEKLIREKSAKGYKEVSSLPAKSLSCFTPMNKKMFWALIHASLDSPSLKKQALYLQKELRQLPQKDLVEVENIFNKLDNQAYTWNLWAAAYTIHRGCSDDSFTDFRAWLITRGQFVFEQALQSSDSLSALGKKALAHSKDGEYFLYLPSTIYEEGYEGQIEKDPHLKSFKIKTTPSGKEWPEGDASALKKINPSLFRLIIGGK